MRQGFLLILSVVFTSVTAADAEELSELGVFYRDLCDKSSSGIWYGDKASDAWNHFSSTYSNSMDSKDRFYGKDITIGLLIAKKATISPSSSSNESVWSYPVPNVAITATIPDVSPEELQQDDPITATIPDVPPEELQQDDPITATIPYNQLRFDWLNSGEAGGNGQPDSVQFSSDIFDKLKKADWFNQQAVAGTEITTVQISDTSVVLNADCTTSKKSSAKIRYKLDVIQSDSNQDSQHGVILRLSPEWLNRNRNLWKKEKSVAGTAVQFNNSNALVNALYDRTIEIKAKLYFEGINKSCSTPNPSSFWEQFLIRSKEEMVICR